MILVAGAYAVCRYDACGYAECHNGVNYTACRSAKCRGPNNDILLNKGKED
jgi:hypothetical protein